MMEEQPAWKVIIALGTNINHTTNMAIAVGRLKDCIIKMKCSREMWTTPVAMSNGTIPHGKFLNMLISGLSYMSQGQLHNILKFIEAECGRTVEDKNNGIVHMDIDILLFGDEIVHADDWHREYIKTLMKDI